MADEDDYIGEHLSRLHASGERPKLTRTAYAVPLEGIDVPFHSSKLLPGVSAFRRCLDNALDTRHVQAQRLAQQWIPNVLAEPFALTKDFVDKVVEVTGTESLDDLYKTPVIEQSA